MIKNISQTNIIDSKMHKWTMCVVVRLIKNKSAKGDFLTIY